VILRAPKDGNLSAALTSAMEAVEAAFPPLAAQLPKDYGRFEGSVLEEMVRLVRDNLLDRPRQPDQPALRFQNQQQDRCKRIVLEKRFDRRAIQPAHVNHRRLADTIDDKRFFIAAYDNRRSGRHIERLEEARGKNPLMSCLVPARPHATPA
jgi:hypothetical protein